MYLSNFGTTVVGDGRGLEVVVCPYQDGTFLSPNMKGGRVDVVEVVVVVDDVVSVCQRGVGENFFRTEGNLGNGLLVVVGGATFGVLLR